MSQSGFIAAMLLAAFIIWLAINNRLQSYTAVLFGPTQKPTPSGNISTSNGIIAPASAAPSSGGIGGTGMTPSLPDLSGGNNSGVGNLLDVPAEVAGLLEFIP
jgi:hypothetical protein